MFWFIKPRGRVWFYFHSVWIEASEQRFSVDRESMHNFMFVFVFQNSARQRDEEDVNSPEAMLSLCFSFYLIVRSCLNSL